MVMWHLIHFFHCCRIMASVLGFLWLCSNTRIINNLERNGFMFMSTYNSHVKLHFLKKLGQELKQI